MVRKLEVKSNLEKIIDKGGDVSADKTHKEINSYFMRLRIPDILNEKIDVSVQNRIGLSKTAWILEAIQEKLKREET